MKYSIKIVGYSQINTGYVHKIVPKDYTRVLGKRWENLGIISYQINVDLTRLAFICYIILAYIK